jgi:hypothetical protein
MRVLAVFVASRVVTTALLLAFAARQPENPWTAAHPGYFDFARIWDGNWYWIVAASGYPTELPLTADGHIGENAWAFLPVYPFLVRAVMTVTGLPFGVGAVIVSVLFAGASALVMYRLFARHLPEGTALFAVVLFCVAPLSPILQVGYAEPVFVFFLALALLLLDARRYLLLIPIVILMDFTRPGGIAFALALGLHIVVRFLRRRAEPFPVRERVASVALTGVAGVAGLAWPVIAWIATGYRDAYTETELSWRMPYVGYQELLPFTPWFQGASWWFERAGWPVALGYVLLVGAIVLSGVMLFSPWVRRLGTDVRLWLASYLLYVLAVFFPQSSTFRILVPLFPALGAIAIPRSRLYRVLAVLVCIALQVVWLQLAWWYDGYDWTPP